MLFRVVDHYSDDDFFDNGVVKKNNTCTDECFVCLSVELDDEECPIKLGCNDLYLRICRCDGFIHQKCLDDWYDVSKKCPVCRIYMEKKIHHPQVAVICIYIVTVVCRMIWLMGWVLYAWTTITYYIKNRANPEIENYTSDDI